ncbi:MAG: phage portal protein [Desulfovibrio sp.]|jgi:hypothetical protein|nr:phage portal protein [Desulfovibrio sp.]
MELLKFFRREKRTSEDAYGPAFGYAPLPDYTLSPTLRLIMSAFDRGSPESRWAAHAIAASNGILTVDEIREIEGWGPMEQVAQ